MQKKRENIHSSFHELSPREYMYIPKGTLEAGKPGSFSKTELTNLLIAIAVLTVSFSFVFSPIYRFHFNEFFLAIPKAFLGILTAFIVHELSHKFVAQKYGLWSEFRMYPKGLLASLLIAVLFGFAFTVPGAVMFRGDSRRFETGKIAAAGATANLCIASLMFLLYQSFFETPFYGELFGFICLINAFLGTFNLIPLSPLDGKKVIEWNGIVWALLFIWGVVIASLIFPIAPLV